MPVEINCPESLNQLIRKLQIELRIDKDSPFLTFIITPNISEYEVQVCYINHIIKQLSNIYVRLINH